MSRESAVSQACRSYKLGGAIARGDFFNSHLRSVHGKTDPPVLDGQAKGLTVSAYAPVGMGRWTQ